jgi:hypothetical protein
MTGVDRKQRVKRRFPQESAQLRGDKRLEK